MSRIYLLEFNADTTIKFQDTNVEIQGNTNGSPTLRIQAPFFADNYTCKIDFVRADNGVQPDRKTGDSKGTVTVNVDGDNQTWGKYEYNFGSDVTKVDTGTGTQELLGTVIFKNKLDASLDETMTVAIFDVQQNSDGSDIEIPANDVTRLDGRIDDLENDKRDRNATSLSAQSTPIPDTAKFTIDLGSGDERSATMAVITDTVQAQGDPSKSYPTITPTTITDPDRSAGFEGFYNERTLRTDVNPPYNPVAQTISIGSLPITNQCVTSTIFNVQDFPIGTYTNLTLENTVYARKVGGDWILSTDYYKRDSFGVETPLQSGIEVTISSSTFTPYIVKDTINGSFTILAGDTLAIKSQIKAVLAVATEAKAQFMGDPETTFTIFNFPSGTISNTKMDLLPLGTPLGELVKSKIDGNVEPTGITPDDILLEDADESISGEWTYTGAKTTFDLDVDILNDLLVGGDATITGNLIVNGTQTILNVTTVETEDNVLLLAKGQATGLVDIGILGNRGSEADIFIGWKEADDLFKFGFVGSEKRFASIIDNPNIDEIFVYDSVTGNLITKTAAEIKTLLSLENVDNTTDLNKPISNATQTALDDKLTSIPVYDENGLVGNATSFKYVGGVTVVMVGDEAVIDMFGTGTGEGLGTLGRFDFDPIVDIDIVDELLTWEVRTVQEVDDGQSTDTTVFELLPLTNTILLKKTASEETAEGLYYKLELPITASSSYQGGTNDLTFTVYIDGIAKVPVVASVGQATIQDPIKTNNFMLPVYFKSDPLLATQEITFYVKASQTGADLEVGTPNFRSTFVSGEALKELMRTPIFATNGTNRVDRATISDAVIVFPTTNIDSDLSSSDTLEPISGGNYVIELPTDMTIDPMTWTKKTIPYDIFEADGITNAIGTDYNEIETAQMAVHFDGAKYIIVSLDKRLETIEAEVLSPSYSTNATMGATINPFTAGTESAPMKANLDGLTLNQEVIDGDAVTNVVSDDNASLIDINTDGTWEFNSTYDATNQTFNIISGNKYFGYFKTQVSSVGDMRDVVYLWYSDETFDNVGTTTSGFSEFGGVITATKTLLANMKMQEGNTGQIDRDYQILIDMTALGIESYTDTQMLDIARKGYFEGLEDSIPEIKTIGKNIFDFNYDTTGIDLVIGGEASDFDLEFISSTGSDIVNIFPTVKFKQDAQYIINGSSFADGASTQARIRLAYTDGSRENVGIPTEVDTPFTLTSDVGKTIDFISALFSGSLGDTTTYKQFMIRLANVTDATYETYRSNDFAPNITLRSNATDFDSLDRYDETSGEFLNYWTLTERVDESHVTLTTPITTELPELDDIYSYENGTLEQVGNLNNEITYSVATNFNAKSEATEIAVNNLDDRMNLLHRDFDFTFIQATWENVLYAPKWSYTVIDDRILTKDEVGFAPNNDTEDVWNNALVFTQGVQDDIAGQAIFLARVQPTADVIGTILLKGVVVDG